MKFCFSKLEPQTRVSGKQRKAAKGRTASVSPAAVVIMDIVAASRTFLMTALEPARQGTGPLSLTTGIVSQRSEAVKGKASPRNNGAPLTAPARCKEMHLLCKHLMNPSGI
jgi:hypothetical protein